MQVLLSSSLHLHGLVVPGWQVNTMTEFLLSIFILAVVVLLQSAVKAAQHALCTTFKVKSRSRQLLLRLLGAVLLAIDVFFGYVIMLAVMTGSVWLVLSVLASSTAGYVFFWWVLIPLGGARQRANMAVSKTAGQSQQTRTDGDEKGMARAAADGVRESPETQRLTAAVANDDDVAPVCVVKIKAGSERGTGINGGGGSLQRSQVLTTFSTALTTLSRQQEYELPPPQLHEHSYNAADGDMCGGGKADVAMPAASELGSAVLSNGRVVTSDGLINSGGSTAQTRANGSQSSGPAAFSVLPDDLGTEWRGSGGNLFNKYPILTKYQKLALEENGGSKEAMELSDLDSALQELIAC